MTVFSRTPFLKSEIVSMQWPLLRILFLAVTLTLSQVSLWAQSALSDAWIPSDRVNDIAVGGGNVFMQGYMDWMGESLVSGAVVFNSDLSRDGTWPLYSGYLYDAISDDAGGYYAAGYTSISHFKADKTIELLDIQTQGIYKILKKGNLLYIGGTFTDINSISRSHLACYDLTAKSVTAWDPNPNGSITTLYENAGVIYAGGTFTTIGGQTRSKIAALDGATGLATAWDAKVITGSGGVYAITGTASAIYFGGHFSNVAAAFPAHPNLAAVSVSTGALLPFNPRPDVAASVTGLLVDGSTAYASGSFNAMNGTSRPALAAVDATSGTLLAFDAEIDPSSYAYVNSSAIDGQHLIVVGYLRTVHGENRGNMLTLDKTTGAFATTIPRNVSGSLNVVVSGNGRLFVAGTTNGVTGLNRSNGCFSLDAAGHGRDWTAQLPPLADGANVESIDFEYYNGRLYFLRQSSDDISTIGALSPTTGALIPQFSATVNGRIDAWTFGKDTLYLAGQFDMINSDNRYGFGAVAASTGKTTAWTVDFSSDDGQVYSLRYYAGKVFVAGNIHYLNDATGDQRTYLMAYNGLTGALTDWTPFADLPDGGYVNVGPAENGKIYLIGNVCFRVDTDKGVDDGWKYMLDDYDAVRTIALGTSAVYIGGQFSPGIFSLDKKTGAKTDLQPQIDDVYDSEGSINSIAVNNKKLLVGGSFSYSIVNDSRSDYAEFGEEDSGNQPPVIEPATVNVMPGKVVTIPLVDLLSDPDGNLDLSTLKIIDPPFSGALASIDADYNLILDYTGITFSGTETLTIEVCDLLSACTQQEIVLETGGALMVYNGISPDGDGKNDFLFIDNIDVFPSSKNKVSVFNRWGDVVFETDDYDNVSNTFQGKSKSGGELPAGTYYYKIAFADGSKSKIGYLSLKR